MVAKKRLPEHPAAGLLWTTLQRNRLSWLERLIPKDFQQEVYLFLLDWPLEVSEKNRKEFSRAASRHFYRVAVKYGFYRPRGSSRYLRREERLDSLFEDAEESGDEIEIATLTWRLKEGSSFWFQEKLQFCRRVLLGDRSPKGRVDWCGFQLYLAGCNLNEIAFLTGWTPSLVQEHLREIIIRIRKAAGVNPAAPMPPMPKRGKVKFRQGRDFGAGSKPARGRIRQFAGNLEDLSNLPLKEIMRRFGVSKATASRIRRRGWFVPDYHKVESGSREWHRRQRTQPTRG